VLLLDNVRFIAEEQTLFEQKLRLTHEEQARTLLVEKLAPLADLYVCDAFAAAHRDQPSLCGFEQVLPSCMGRLFEKEYCTVSRLMEAPDRPCVFVLGGAKISDAFLMMRAVLKSGAADRVLTGGLVGNVFLTALGREIGQGSLDFIVKSNYGEYIPRAKELYAEYGDRVSLPSDLAWIEDGVRREAPVGSVPRDVSAVDVGHLTARAYREAILGARTVFVNGPMGVFEKDAGEYGTREVWQALADTGGHTVLGGGDSIAAAEKYGLTEKMGYVCTGGGALIRFLTGEELPVVKALRHGSGLTQAEGKRGDMEEARRKELAAFAVRIRMAALEAIHSLGSGHVGGSLSIADALAALYGGEMRIDPQNPRWPDRDKLVCSKGHAGPAVYGALALKGYFPYEELRTLNRPGTRLPSHCDRNKTPGVDMTTGSLGQGTSLAAGMALGDKLKGRPSRVFLIVGDGESNEGQVWEAFAFAAAKKLDNLVVLLDWNKRQLDGWTEEVFPMGDFGAKLAAFGFDTVRVDGNDVEEVAAALKRTRTGAGKPFAILLDTVKGSGVPEVAGTVMNHSLPVSDGQYERWTALLRAELAELEG